MTQTHRRPSLPLAAVQRPALVPALARALTLLDRLAANRVPMSLAQLTSDLSLPKSSVHGLCSTLVSFGYLRRQDDGAFVIGPRVMGLAEAFVAGTNVAREFHSLWKDAGMASDETVILSVLNGADVIYVGARNGSHPLGLAFNVGMRLPAHLAGTGKAMLAYQDAASVRRLFPSGRLSTMTGKGPKTLAALMKELELVRQTGISIDDESVQEGVYSIAAAVFDASGQPVAGIGVCINKAMLGADGGERHRQAVLRFARVLTQRLGGEMPPPETAHRTRSGSTA